MRKRAQVAGGFFFEVRVWGVRAGGAAATAEGAVPVGWGQRSGKRRVSRPTTTHTGTHPAPTSSTAGAAWLAGAACRIMAERA